MEIKIQKGSVVVVWEGNLRDSEMKDGKDH